MGVKDREHVEVTSIAELRRWLADQPPGRDSVWLVHFKKHVSEKYVSWPDLVRTCLCFGWVDSQVKTVDADRVKHLISPRRAGSTWSAVNKRLIDELEAAGLMTDAGRRVVERAKSDGSWTFLDEIEALVVPADLQAALDQQPTAAATWAAYPDSEKKQSLFQLKSAKKPETRLRRLQKIISNAVDGRRSWT